MVIQIAIFFILANSLFGIILFFNLIRIRRKKKKIDSRIDNIQAKSEDLFLDFLVSAEDLSMPEVIEQYENQIEKLNPKSMETIAGALENLVLKNRTLRQSKNFMAIIGAFDLLNYLEDNMSSFSTKKRLSVFQILSNLELTVSDSKILPHTYSKNKSITKGSRSSYIGVSKNDPFKFFETNRESELNAWDQISLMQQFDVHHKENLPDFSKWIKYTKQKSQIIFFVRMTAHFNQTNSVSTISDLLNSDDHDIRYEAIVCLGKLNYATVEAKLTKIFYSQPEICQKAIVETITIFQTGMAFEFLRNAYETAANIETRLLLAEALYLYKPLGLQYFKNKIQKEEGFNKLILQHVQNPLIKSELKDRLDKNVLFNARKTKRIVKKKDSDVINLIPMLKN